MAAIIKNDKIKLIHKTGFFKILVCDDTVCFSGVFIEGKKNNIPKKDIRLIMAHSIKDDCQLNNEAIKVANGMPMTLDIVNPPKTIATPFEDGALGELFAAVESAIDQKTGCKKAGNNLAIKSILKLVANTEIIFEKAKMANTNNINFFLFNDDIKSIIKGPDMATIKANKLKSCPAFSIVIAKAEAI